MLGKKISTILAVMLLISLTANAATASFAGIDCEKDPLNDPSVTKTDGIAIVFTPAEGKESAASVTVYELQKNPKKDKKFVGKIEEIIKNKRTFRLGYPRAKSGEYVTREFVCTLQSVDKTGSPVDYTFYVDYSNGGYSIRR